MSGTQLNLSGYKLTFDDQFADDTNADIGLPGTPGIKWETSNFYGDLSNGGQGTIDNIPPGQPGSLISLQDGMLVENFNPTQAVYLDTNPNGVPGGFSQQYGYFEVSAKLTGVAGYNSDFWMMPNSGPWPPEFDVYEHNGYIAGDYEMTNHGGDASTPPQNLDLYNVPNLTTQFNTFGFQWTPTTLTWYINGQEVFSAPTASNENQPFNLILSGGPSYASWLPPPLAGSSDQYDIQWVHAYSNDPNAAEIAGMPGYQDHDGSTSLGGSTGGTSGGTSGDIDYITPGNGSFTDSAGNVYTLTAADVATENGQAMNGGGGTGAMEYANGTVYGQDMGSGTWYTWDQSINNWQLATTPPPPPSGGSSGSGSGSGTGTGGTGGSSGGSGSTGSGGNTGGGSGSGSTVDYITPGSGSFTDAAGNVYTLTSADVATENGQPMNGGAGTGAMEYANSTVYGQDAGSGTWYTWDQSANNWQLATTPPPSPNSPPPPPPPPPPPLVPVPLVVPGAGSFVDAAGNVYTLDAQHNALENGQLMNNGAGTGQMELVGGNIFASDFSSGTWYEWSQSQNNWIVPTTPPSTNTATGQNPTTITMTATQTAATTISESNIVLNLAGGNKITFTGGSSIINATGSNTVTDQGSDNTVALGATGKTTLNANALNNGDVFDLTKALAATSWDGNTGDLSTYLKMTTSGWNNQNAVLEIRDTATGSWRSEAVFTKSGALDLSQFLVHAKT